MDPLSRSIALVVLLALAAPSPAHAAPAAPAASDFRRYFDSAVQLYRTLDFERSLDQLKLAKLQPHSADEDVLASMYEGILRFELGDEPGSASAFRAALFLNPSALMPVTVSPRITLMLERERTRLRQKAPVTAPQPVPVAVQARPLVDLPPPDPVPAPAAPPPSTAAPTPTDRRPPPAGPAEPQQPQTKYWTAPPSQREDTPRTVRVVRAQESIAVPASVSADAGVVATSPAVATPKVERRLWAIAPLAAGVVGLGAGVGFLVQTGNYYNGLLNDPLTPAQAANYRTQGKSYQAAGITLTALGTAAAVAGAVLLAIPLKPAAPAPVAVAPLLTDRCAGISLSGNLP
ncbi:MAG: hypothetical protein QM765_28235 [Myxococcales bacterium]